MPRNFDDWLKAYVDYAGYSEAPKRMHFWCGVSAIAACLRRRVWIDESYFRWYPNHYIIIVAPPGIVSKSTTVQIATNLLHRVPGINFGPDVMTWPALVEAFAKSAESFEYNGSIVTQSALTLESSELGNFLDPTNRELIDLLVSLWDCKQGTFKKITKGSGSDTVLDPWINLIGCTTPAWIAGYFPEYVIGGGFTSRCLFIYTENKEKYVAYPHLDVPAGLSKKAELLTNDLEYISNRLIGPYALTPQALDFGKDWYITHYKDPHDGLDGDRFGGYLARKQTHIHKLAMILAASQRDDMTITPLDLQTANHMLTDLETDMPKVFAKIGRSPTSIHTEKFLKWCYKNSPVSYEAAHRYIHNEFPLLRDYESMLGGCIKAGLLKLEYTPTGIFVVRGVAVEA